MRPHVNAYCAHENGLHTVNKPLRQQVAASCCTVAAYHTPTTPNFAQQQLSGPKWSATNACYNGIAVQKSQQHAKLPLHFQPNQAFPLLPTTAAINQHNLHTHHHATHQQHPHLQRLSHFHHGTRAGPGFVAHATSLPPPALLSAQHMPEAMTHNYAKLPAHVVNQQRINECAGIPLISNASTHVAPTQRQRVMRKSSSQSPSHIQHQQQHAPLMGLRTEAAAYAWGMPPNAPYIAQASGNCIPQLPAHAHAHGLPLRHNKINSINKNNNNNNNNNNNHKNWSSACASATHYDMHTNGRFQVNAAYAGYTLVNTTSAPLQTNAKLEKSRLLRYQNSAPAALNPVSVSQSQNIGSISDTTELKNLGDTCLPRIIKPRKRRKKDRKPTTATGSGFLKFDTPTVVTPKTHGNDTLPYIKSHKSDENLFSGLRDFSHMNEVGENNGFTTEDGLMPLYKMDNGRPECAKSPLIAGGAYLWNTNGDNLRSIWDYPLRRSFSDSSTTATTAKFRSILCLNSESSASSSSGSSTTSSYSSSCSSTDSFSSADLFSPLTSESSRADVVGVIGSNRAQNQDANLFNTTSSVVKSVGANGVATLPLNMENSPRKTILSASLSDSNDSGYGDILTGINIVNDIFGCATKADDSFALLSGISHACGTVGESMNDTSEAAPDAASLLLLPATAETLLNESINEISRKLIETCGNELSDFSGTSTELPHSAASLACFSTCSDFSSDSGIDSNNTTAASSALLNCDELIFNFENLNMNSATHSHVTTTTTQFPTLSKTASTMDNFLMHLHNNKKNIDENNNYTASGNNKQQQEQQNDQKFLKNCSDLFWPSVKNEAHTTPPITSVLTSVVKFSCD